LSARRPRSRVQRRLLEWYARNRRDLPWRRDLDPWRGWVSQVMLQQTTVRTVLPYYERFLERFPDPAALAAAPEEEVLGVWSGLGYYHRARNLRRGAQHVVERWGGRFPETLEAALSVPGVGLYTASAVLSICYGEPLPVVDGNVRRVLARLQALAGPAWRSDAPFYNRAEELLDREAPGDWNQALMELGATVCTPKRPGCAACPLRGDCRAYAEGLQERLPEKRGRRAPIDVVLLVALVERDGRLLLARREEGKLLGRMWELPQTPLEPAPPPDLASSVRERYGISIRQGELRARARHAITFRRIRVEGYAARLLGRAPAEGDRFCGIEPGAPLELSVSSRTRKLLAGLADPQKPLPLGD